MQAQTNLVELNSLPSNSHNGQILVQHNNLVDGSCKFASKAYDNIAETIIAKLGQLKVSASDAAGFDTVAKLVAGSELPFFLASKDAAEYALSNKEIDFSSGIARRALAKVERLVTEEVTSYCKRINIEPSVISQSRLHSAILVYISMRAEEHLKLN